MSERRIPMTPEGKKTLEEKLKLLKGVERVQNIRDIEEARAHGDLSENAEYHAAKEKQGILNAQIIDIEAKISLAQVIDPKEINSEKIVFGASVTVADLETEEERTYKIVGADEANVSDGKISVESPIARALIGKEEGDEVKFRTPKGLRELEIVNIDYK